MSSGQSSLRKRPVNLALWTIRFPITAIISILHRLSGLFLFLLIPVCLYTWQLSLLSVDSFNTMHGNFGLWYFKLLSWLALAALIYHLIAGVRHLLMDMHIGDSKQAGKASSYLVLILTLVLAALLGAYIW